MDYIFPEEESLLKNIPDIINGSGKTLLYVGASFVRAYLYDRLLSYGYNIDIIEIFQPNVDFLQKKGFKVICGDIKNVQNYINKKYDVIFWWHGPEHIEKEHLADTLLKLEKYGDLIILGCPSDETDIQGEVYGNIYEKHLWNPQTLDFENLDFKTCRISRAPACDHITSWKYIKK